MKPKTETREYGDCMLRIRPVIVAEEPTKTQWEATRYTLMGRKNVILDITVLGFPVSAW